MTPPPTEFRFLSTLPGRLFLLSGASLLVLFIVRQFVALPDVLEVFRKVVSLAVIVAIVWLAVLAVIHNRRRLLWRVRRKLILSYVFLGFVPVVLVVAFALAASVVLYINVAAYVFSEGFGDLLDDVYQIAETSAGEIGRNPAVTEVALARKYENLAKHYPALALAVLPAGEGAGSTNGSAQSGKAKPPAIVVAGPWRHMRPPTAPPEWLSRSSSGFRGVVAYTAADAPDEWHLAIRAAVPTPNGARIVIADVPVDTEIIARLADRTTIRMGDLSIPASCGGTETQAVRTRPSNVLSLFSESVAFMDCTNWLTGKSGRVAINLASPVRRLYGQVVSGQLEVLAGPGLLGVLFLLGFLLLVVQGAALSWGVVLARSITSAVHELFEGTERARQGDFGYRIKIESRDQLGDLATSFNRMSGSIEHLLHVQREKQRLDDELRIAHDIQKSLLPIEPPRVPGVSIADLCEPARQVGGDYYDFFDLGEGRMGVLVADVSGKGTSAALYTAELKGLMIALSHNERSPRRLLVDVNRLLSAHLDNRSFITMTYAVIDFRALTLTFARAGHTPLIVVSDGKSEVIAPSGMVLGLRLPGAADRFEELLEEHTRPISAGDVVVLYTDGITEAMDAEGELFGDAALARVVESHRQLDAPGIRERVLREVKAFVGDAEPHDDMTMVVLKFDGDGRGASA
jgi:serine phosphatase RsbU (regulator of sigma subunit)